LGEGWKGGMMEGWMIGMGKVGWLGDWNVGMVEWGNVSNNIVRLSGVEGW